MTVPSSNPLAWRQAMSKNKRTMKFFQELSFKSLIANHPFAIWSIAAPTLVVAMSVSLSLWGQRLVGRVPMFAVGLLALSLSIYLVVVFVYKKSGAVSLVLYICLGLAAGLSSFVSIFYGSMYLMPMLPNPAMILYWVAGSYIEAHAEIDPLTGIRYYPISYTSIYVSGVRLPQSFFVFDRGKDFMVDYYARRQVLPFCLNSRGAPERYLTQIDQSIYEVGLDIDDPSKIAIYCLRSKNGE
jgi:hypothetical protein